MVDLGTVGRDCAIDLGNREMNTLDPGAILANQALAAIGESQLTITQDNTAIANPITNARTTGLVNDLAALAPTISQAVAGAESGVSAVGSAIQSGYSKAGSALESLGASVGKTAGNIIGGILNWKVFLLVVAILVALVIVLPKLVEL